LLWGPPERSVWRAKRAVSSVQKRFGFRQTNAPKSDFRKIEDGKNQNPTLDTLNKLAKALEVSVDNLIKWILWII